MATIDQIVAANQKLLDAREYDMTRRAIKGYEAAWARMEREIRKLERHIADVVAAGGAVDPSWLHRQQWFREVQEGLERELAAWRTGSLIPTVTAAQRSAVSAAGTFSQQMHRLVRSPWRGDVYAKAMEQWTSAVAPNSPVGKLVRSYGYDAGKAIERAISEGIGTGQGSKTIIRNLRRELGPDAMTPRLATLVRTETNRAYRGAFAQTMKPLEDDGIVTGYIWLADLSNPRTCFVCIGKHGQRFKAPPGGQHPNCRCRSRPVVDPELVPGGGYKGPKGNDWLKQQPEDVQRRILGPTRLEHFKQGTTLAQMTEVKQHPDWGKTFAPKPLSALGTPGAPKPKPKPRPRPKPAPQPAGMAWTPETYGVDLTPPGPTYQWPWGDRGAMQSRHAKVPESSVMDWDGYMRTEYYELNKALRKDQWSGMSSRMKAEWEQKIRRMDAAMATHNTGPKAMTVHRGMGTSQGAPVPGKIVTDHGYMSTSTGTKSAIDFLKPDGWLVDMELPPNVYYVPGTEYEKEWIMPRGSRMVITSVERRPISEVKPYQSGYYYKVKAHYAFPEGTRPIPKPK